MRNLRRNKRKLYLCQKYEDNGIDKYKEPKLIYENYLPTNAEGDLVSLGMDYPMYLRMKPSIDEVDMFHEGDRFYIYTEPPTVYDEMCKDADYEIYKKPMIHLNSLEVMLYRRSGDRDEYTSYD